MLSFLPCISTHLKCPQVTYVKHNRIVGNGVYIVFRREHVFESPLSGFWCLQIREHRADVGWGGGGGRGLKTLFLTVL